MSREIDKGSIVVDEGDLVIVSRTSKKKDGVFAKVGIAALRQGYALVGFQPVIDDKSKHMSTTGMLLPNLSPQKSVLLTGEGREFIEGRDFSLSLTNKLDRARYFIGKKLLGW